MQAVRKVERCQKLIGILEMVYHSEISSLPSVSVFLCWVWREKWEVHRLLKLKGNQSPSFLDWGAGGWWEQSWDPPWHPIQSFSEHWGPSNAWSGGRAVKGERKVKKKKKWFNRNPIFRVLASSTVLLPVEQKIKSPFCTLSDQQLPVGTRCGQGL